LFEKNDYNALLDISEAIIICNWFEILLWTKDEFYESTTAKLTKWKTKIIVSHIRVKNVFTNSMHMLKT